MYKIKLNMLKMDNKFWEDRAGELSTELLKHGWAKLGKLY